jgi:hypothetical protein
MSRPASIALLGLVLAATGCATVPPTQVKKFAEAQLIVDKTIAHYGLQRVRLFVGDVPPNASAGFAGRQNWIILRDDVLDGDHWLTILAHELGHVVLGHDMPIVLGGQGQHIEASAYRRAEQQREIDANRKAVEVMTRVVGVPEREAMRKMATFLLGANESRGGRAVALPHGHIHPCDQFDRLIAGFPQEWSADLSCKKQIGPYRGPLVGTDADLKLTR